MASRRLVTAVLKGIDPLLTGDLLKVLDDKGHSGRIVIADANFPAHRTHSVVTDAPGIDVVRMTRAVRYLRGRAGRSRPSSRWTFW